MTRCGQCGEEVRFGVRGTTTGWLHRGTVDHNVVHGQPTSPADAAAWELEQVKERRRISTAAAKRCPTYQDLWPLEVYTTREHDIKRDDNATRRARRLAEYRGEDIDYVEPIPEPESRRRDVQVESFPPRSGIRQLVNLVLKTDGWELRRLTHARGPYVGAAGTVLSISDTIVMGARGPGVDGGRAIAVASWRDGAFDTGYTGVVKGGHVHPAAATSTAIKAWIKENTS